MILGAPLIAGGLVLVPAMIELAGGSEFADSATPLRVLLAAGALAWVNGVFGFALIAKQRQASAMWLNVTVLAFNLMGDSLRDAFDSADRQMYEVKRHRKATVSS